MTVAELLAWGAAAIKPIAPETAAREASILLAHVLGGPVHQLTLMRDREAEDDVEIRFRDLVLARSQRRCPVQYLTGQCEFYSLKLRVGVGVFIPRPETELVVETALETLATSIGRPGSIADVGTGSGCIAIALAVNLSQGARKGSFHVFALDTNETALDVARENARIHGVADVMTFLKQDAFDLRAGLTVEALRALPGEWKFRMIVSNPPYVTEEEYAHLEPEVRDWEPRAALVGGPDGLDLIRHLVQTSPSLLESGGHLIMEIGAGHAERLRRLDWPSFGFSEVTYSKDLAGIERVVRARLR